MNTFAAVEGPYRGKTFELGDTGSIGRGDECAVRLEGRHVSRIHAIIEKRADAFFIKDNGSRNGIYVNGNKVAESVLRSDDELEVGEHVLVFNPKGDPARKSRMSTAIVERVENPLSLEAGDKRVLGLLEVAINLVGRVEIRDIARSLLDAILSEVSADRGVVMVADEKGAFKHLARKVTPGNDEFFISNVLHHDLLSRRRGVIATDLIRKEPDAGKPLAILAVPLAAKGAGVRGLVYVERRLASRDDPPPFTRADLGYAGSLAAFAGVRVAQLQGEKFPRPGSMPLGRLVRGFERICITEALRMSSNDPEVAAKVLQITLNDLEERQRVLKMIPPKKESPAADWKSVE